MLKYCTSKRTRKLFAKKHKQNRTEISTLDNNNFKTYPKIDKLTGLKTQKSPFPIP